MAEQQITQETSSHVDARFRIDVKLHEILMEPKQAEKRTTLQPKGLTLPQPVYPQREYSLTDPTLTQYQKMNARRTWNAWGKPYFLSRSVKSRKELRPIIAYLFTDYKCNLDCHYCWSYNNTVNGLDEDTARRAPLTGCTRWAIACSVSGAASLSCGPTSCTRSPRSVPKLARRKCRVLAEVTGVDGRALGNEAAQAPRAA